MSGAAASANGSTATVKQPAPDPPLLRKADYTLLCLIEIPCRGHDTAILSRVGVAEHYLLSVVICRQQLAVAVVGKEFVEDRCAVLQVIDGFKQG